MKAALFSLALLLASTAYAGPLSRIKDALEHHKRFEAAAGAIVGGSIVQYKGTTYCQLGDVE